MPASLKTCARLTKSFKLAAAQLRQERFFTPISLVFGSPVRSNVLAKQELLPKHIREPRDWSEASPWAISILRPAILREPAPRNSHLFYRTTIFSCTLPTFTMYTPCCRAMLCVPAGSALSYTLEPIMLNTDTEAADGTVTKRLFLPLRKAIPLSASV